MKTTFNLVGKQLSEIFSHQLYIFSWHGNLNFSNPELYGLNCNKKNNNIPDSESEFDGEPLAEQDLDTEGEDDITLLRPQEQVTSSATELEASLIVL